MMQEKSDQTRAEERKAKWVPLETRPGPCYLSDVSDGPQVSEYRVLTFDFITLNYHIKYRIVLD